MTGNFEAKHPRATDGKFTEKYRKEADLTLDLRDSQQWEQVASEMEKEGVPREAFDYWTKKKGITDPEAAREVEDAYYGKYNSWGDFVKDRAKFKDMKEHFQYGLFAWDLKINCKVEKTEDGVIIHNHNPGFDSKKAVKANSFAEYAKDVAYKTIIETEDENKIREYCDYLSVSDDLIGEFCAAKADSGVYVFRDI